MLQELTRQLLVEAVSILCALQIDGLVLYLRVERTYRDDIRTLAAQLAYSAVGVAVGPATLYEAGELARGGIVPHVYGLASLARHHNTDGKACVDGSGTALVNCSAILRRIFSEPST